MYLASVERPVAPARAGAAKIAANVLALGTVSLVTDVSSEMVTAILPLYLVAGLGLGPAGYGLVDGLYTGATALLRLAGGYVADKVQRRKLVAGLGHGISAEAKAGLLLAGGSLAGIGAAVVADRAGKGLRTAPRDALITLSTPAESLGRAFGVHRAMDSAGAFAGPLVAIAVLAASAQDFDAVFVVSGCVATIGVLVLVLFVGDRPVAPAAAKAVNLRRAAALLRRGRIRMLLLGAVLLGLATIGDGFVYLLLQRREDLATGWFPLLAVATGLALIQTGQALAYLVSSVLFGLAWQWWGATGAIRVTAAAAALTLAGSATMLLRTRAAS